MSKSLNKNIHKNIYILNLYKVVDEYFDSHYSYKLQPDIRETDRNYLLGKCKWFDITSERQIDIVIEKRTYEKWKSMKCNKCRENYPSNCLFHE
jgi:hypothetical protein